MAMTGSGSVAMMPTASIGFDFNPTVDRIRVVRDNRARCRNGHRALSVKR
ncbi:DUF4394 domain-containing protein [Noviherbaspirillum sp. Root189]